MSHLFARRWLAVLPALSALAAGAQSLPASPEPAPAELPYQSAFEAYQCFQDDKPISWKQANDTVRQRGGWRAYAKESAGTDHGEHGGGRNAPTTTPTPAPADPHAGHRMPTPAQPEARDRP